MLLGRDEDIEDFLCNVCLIVSISAEYTLAEVGDLLPEPPATAILTIASLYQQFFLTAFVDFKVSLSAMSINKKLLGDPNLKWHY